MGRKTCFCLGNIWGHVPGMAFLLGLQFVGVHQGSCSPLKPSLSCGKAVGENSHGSAVRDWDGRGPTTVPGCSCTRKYEKQYRVLILLIERHSHMENVWWVMCHKPPAPSGWGGRCHHPLNMALLQKYTWKGPGGFSHTVPSGVR